MAFDLWDVETNNLVGSYENERAALESVRDLLAANGPDYVGALALGHREADGRLAVIAEGIALGQRASTAGLR